MMVIHSAKKHFFKGGYLCLSILPIQLIAFIFPIHKGRGYIMAPLALYSLGFGPAPIVTAIGVDLGPPPFPSFFVSMSYACGGAPLWLN